jgi:hypothetical protein
MLAVLAPQDIMARSLSDTCRSSPFFASSPYTQAILRARSTWDQHRPVMLPCLRPVASANRTISRWFSGSSLSSAFDCSGVIQRTGRFAYLYSLIFGAFSIHSHSSRALRTIARIRARWRLAVAALASDRLHVPIAATAFGY